MNIHNSQRLRYRLMNQNDAQLLYELDQDPAVMAYINGGKPNSMEDIKNIFIPRLVAFTNPKKGWGLWHTSTRSNNEFIGWILVRPMGFFNNCQNDLDLELGWRFKKSTWGQGYATEAAQNIINKLTEDPSLQALSATAIEENLGSIKVMQNVGMTYVKHYIHKDPLGETKAVLYRRNLK